MADKTAKAERVCVVCGKPLPKGKRKICSDECTKIWNTQYNSKYIKERREKDEEFADKTRKWSIKSTRRGFGEKRWNSWLEQADIILRLAQEPNAQALIAKYLDMNFETRMYSRTTRKYQSK